MKNQIIVTISIIFLILNITLVTSCTAQSDGKEKQEVVKNVSKKAETQMLATQKPQISSEATKTIDENLQKIEKALSSGVYDNNPEMKKRLQEMADRLEVDRKKTKAITKTNAAKKAKEGETVIYSTQDEKTGKTITLEMTKEEYKKYRGNADGDAAFEDKKKAIESLEK